MTRGSGTAGAAVRLARLFSLPRYASLPGWRIPVRRGERVSSVVQEGDRFRVTTTSGTFLAGNVVVATGAHRRPSVPAFAEDLDPAIRQLTSTEYRSPGQLAPGPVLVVGAGNSGTDVALDAAAAGHEVLLAGRHPGQVPFDIDGRSGRVAVPLVMFVFRHVLTIRTPMGRRMRVQREGHGVGLVRNKLADLDAAGVRRIGRIESVVDGRPAAEDGVGLDVGTVVLHRHRRFLELPEFDDSGRPLHERGISPIPGLAFLGLPFRYALASQQIQGVDRDARHLVKHLRPAARIAA